MIETATRSFRLPALLLATALLGCASEPDRTSPPTNPEDFFQDLTGTVVVTDEAGREYPLATGTATFHVRDRWGVSAREVPVEAGRMVLRIPAESQLELHGLILDGRPASSPLLQPGGSPRPIPIAKGGTFQIEARW